MNRYLVGLYGWDADTDKYTRVYDGELRLFDNGSYTITGQTGANKETVFYGDFSKKDTFVINSIKNINNKYDVEINADGRKFGVRFDRSSSAAYGAFMKEYHKIKECHCNTSRYYNGGNIWMHGDILNNEFTGHCVEYYDNVCNSVKYVGEMEDGDYDGSGEFFSECGLIRVCANNICNGVPNGTGKLYVCDKLLQTFKYNDLPKLDTSSVTYCNDVLQHIRKIDHIAIYRDGKFKSLSAEGQISYLFSVISDISDELEKTKSRLDRIEKKSWRLF